MENTPHLYTFGEFTLDLTRGELTHADLPVKLRPKSFQMLRYFIDRRGELVTRDDLLTDLWGDVVVTDDSINQCLVDIRRAIHDTSHDKIRTVHGRGYVFETPVVVTESLAPMADRSLPKSTRTWLWRGALLLITAGAFYAFVSPVSQRVVNEQPVSTPTAVNAEPTTIAVLPFVDMSPEQNQAYFADGISEEIINLLVKLPDARVIARTSSFSFRGDQTAIDVIADRLNASHIVEGSVRKDNNQIRVTAQLIDARDGTHIWSETFDRKFDSVFAIQDEIARSVARYTQGAFIETASSSSIDPEAYSLYWRAHYIANTLQTDKYPLAIELLEEALAIEPHYIQAIQLLGVYRYVEHVGDPSANTEKLFEELEETTRQLVALAPNDIRTVLWQAFIARTKPAPDFQRAADLYTDAYRLDPDNIELLRHLSSFLREINRFEDTIRITHAALKQDPLCTSCLHALGTAYRALGQPENVIQYLRDSVAWNADRETVYWSLGAALLQSGRPREALAAFGQEQNRDLAELGSIMALHDLGQTAEFEQRFAAYRKRSEETLDEAIARIYAWIGDTSNSIMWLENVVKDRKRHSLIDVFGNGFYDTLRQTTEFDELMKHHAIDLYAMRDIEFNIDIPDP